MRSSSTEYNTDEMSEGQQADLNLGTTTYVNGPPMNPVQLDTSTVATDTISYVATDQTGLTATSTRIVVVAAPDSADDSVESPQGSPTWSTSTVIIEAADAPSIVPSAAASTTSTTATSSVQ